jgi:hypothetical protein
MSYCGSHPTNKCQQQCISTVTNICTQLSIWNIGLNMKDGIRCEQGKICSAGNCIDPSPVLKSKNKRILLDFEEPIYEWETECVLSKNTTQCKTSANEYDTTEQSCSCDVEPKIRYQWGESKDRCDCYGNPTDDIPCLDTENGNAEVPDSNCGCSKPTQPSPCEPPSRCYEWQQFVASQCSPSCGGGRYNLNTYCKNYYTTVTVSDTKCAHQSKPPSSYVTKNKQNNQTNLNESYDNQILTNQIFYIFCGFILS